MPEPVLRLRVQFTDGVWTDLSSRLLNYTYSHARDEKGRYEAARMLFLLDNTDRALDPEFRGYRQSVIDDGASIYWRLGGDTTDLGSLGVVPTYTGTVDTVPSLIANTASQASELSGGTSGDYVKGTVAGGSSTALSMECWLRPANTTADQMFLTFPRGSGNFLRITSGGTWAMSAAISGTQRTKSTGIAVTPNTLYHIVYTFDGTKGRFYINGTERSTLDFAGTQSWSTGELVAGIFQTTDLRGFYGTIDEVAVYTSVALTPAQVRAHYEMGTGGGDGYWPDVDTDRLLDFRESYTNAAGTTTDYDLFTGTTQGWELRIEYPEESVVLLTALDHSAALSLVRFESTAHAQQVRALRPTHWWRLGEPSGAVSTTTAVDAAGALHGTYTGPTKGATSLVPKDTSDSAVTFDGVNDYISIPRGVGPFNDEFTVALWMKFDTSLVKTSGSPYLVQFDAFEIYFDWNTFFGSGVVQWLVRDSSGSTVNTTSTVGIADGAVHHVVCTYSPSAGPLVYIDSVLRSPAMAGGPATFTDIGGAIGAGLGGGFGRFKGTIDEVVLYDRLFTAAEVQELYNAGNSAFGGESTRDRVNRYLDWAEWSDVERVDPGVGRTTMQGITSLSTAWEEIEKAMDTEYSRAWLTPQGKVAWLSRDRTFEAPYNTSQATFSDAPTGSELGYEELSNPRKDNSLLRNEWAVSSQGQATQVSRDEASIARRKTVRTGSRSIQTESAEDMRNMADLLVAMYGNPPVRVEKMTLVPYGDEDRVYPEILTRRVGDRITVKYTAPGGGAQVTREAVVLGIDRRWDGSSRRYEASYELSAAEALTFWVWDTSTWDATTRWGY